MLQATSNPFYNLLFIYSISMAFFINRTKKKNQSLERGKKSFKAWNQSEEQKWKKSTMLWIKKVNAHEHRILFLLE